jgi:ribonuclease-3
VQGEPAYEELEAALGYAFLDRDLLRAALRHETFLNENPQTVPEHIARLAFLGDAVIELVARDLLMVQRPEARAGSLSDAADTVVPDAHLADLARGLGLGRWLVLGNGEDNPAGRDNTTILADAMEAVAGAIYRDAEDPSRALAVVRRLLMAGARTEALMFGASSNTPGV